jgi:pimeloyl-ACP methyl ester carboxylesterase
VWDGVIRPIHEATGARIISYDRAGYGRSDPAPGPYSIDSEVAALGRALDSLGIKSCLLFVAHSYGGFISTLYTAQHPDRVCGAVLVDADLVAFFYDAEIERLMAGYGEEREEILQHTVIDIVAAHPPAHSDAEIENWREVHAAFVKAAPARRGRTATDSGHFIMRDSPGTVTDAVTELYRQLDRKSRQ